MVTESFVTVISQPSYSSGELTTPDIQVALAERVNPSLVNHAP